MKKIMIGFILVMSQNLFAQMFQGTVSEATEIKYHLKGTPCYVYVHSADEENAEVTMHFGSGKDFFAEQLKMRKKDVYIGEVLARYDYGYSKEYFTRVVEDEKHSYPLRHFIHAILKFDESKENAKFIYWYAENDGNFFNEAPSFKIECKMTKSDHLR